MKIRVLAAIALLHLLAGQSSAQPLQEVSIEGLAAKFKANPRLELVSIDSKPKHHSEAVLKELIARGADALSVLRDLHNSQPPLMADESEWSLNRDLALLTAIRHIEGKSAPLKIRVRSKAQVRGTTRLIPQLPVEVVNVDAERKPVWFTFGGD